MRITVLGGGTGTFTTLTGLKKHPVDLSAIISMSDGGGSTGVLRDELGVLPPGDIRQCLVALSEADEELRDLFLFRFPNESLNGHNFGNLFLSALEMTTGDSLKAIEIAHKILRVNGKIIPVSGVASNLIAKLRDGTELNGEATIDERDSKRSPIDHCVLRPSVAANPEAAQALRESDAVVIAPGDLYTSIIPTLLVDGITKTLRSLDKPIIYVLNLVTKPGQTDGYSASKHIEVIREYLGGRYPDVVIMNSAKPSPALQERYEAQDECLISAQIDSSIPSRIVSAPLISESIQKPVPHDTLTRSLLRHDPDKLAHAILLCL